MAIEAAEIRAQLMAALQAAGVDTSRWPDGLRPELSLDQDMGVDSFQLMHVARHLEKAYGYAFSVADWVLAEEEGDEPRFTVASLVGFVQAALA